MSMSHSAQRGLAWTLACVVGLVTRIVTVHYFPVWRDGELLVTPEGYAAFNTLWLFLTGLMYGVIMGFLRRPTGRGGDL